MKLGKFGCAVFLLLTLTLAACAHAPPPRADLAAREKEVIRAQHELCAAYLRGDTQAMARMVADGFTLTNGRGEVSTKQDDIEMARTGAITYSVFENHDMKVRFHGESVAVVLGRTKVKGVMEGKPFEAEVVFTDTLVYIDGRWQIVAGHVSLAPTS